MTQNAAEKLNFFSIFSTPTEKAERAKHGPETMQKVCPTWGAMNIPKIKVRAVINKQTDLKSTTSAEEDCVRTLSTYELKLLIQTLKW